MPRVAAAVAFLLLIAASAVRPASGGEEPADPRPPLPAVDFAIVGAALETAAAAGRIDDGVLVVRNGRIDTVGPRGTPVPAGMAVLDLSGSGAVVMPGIIDTHSHMGVYAWPGVEANADGNEASDPVRPEVRAIDSVNAEDPAFARARAGGVTTVMVLPGSANLVGGQAAILKLRPGGTVEAMRFEGAPPSMKMAFGENPKRVYGGRGAEPRTRMGNLAVLRRVFTEARAHGEALDRHRRRVEAGEKDLDPPDRDLRKEALLGVLRGEFRVQVHCYTRSDILALLRLADEFGFKVTAVHHALEAYKCRDALAAHGAAICTWADWWGFKIEAMDGIPENAALCAAAGVLVACHSDSSEGVQRLHHEAAKMMAAGLPRAEAVRAVTLNGARVLGVEARVGSLEPGKDADLALFSEDPFSIYTRVEATWIDGRPVHRRGSR